MASFLIIEDGFITEPYATKYGFQSVEGQNTVRSINGDKVGMIVTLTAQGKPDISFYHEVEWECSDDQPEKALPNQARIDSVLQSLADNYANS